MKVIRAVLIATLALLATQAWLATGAANADALTGLHVSGAHLLDANGKRVMLRGVNRSGTEYACAQGWSIFDGPSDEASVRAIAAWHVNFVRVLLNEDCWLGINGVKPALSGRTYRQAIVDYVALLHRYGIYAEISLIWGAPGRMRALSQPRAPDADHSPATWASMAATFKRDPDVVLAPWGEPLVSARCLLHGGRTCPRTRGRTSIIYRTAGMQQAVNVMRAAGYRGPIAIPGLNYANDMSQWLSFEPRDPLHQLIAEAHVYGKNACSAPACFDRTMAPVARRVPLIFGETGETYDASSCDSTNIATFLHWADTAGVGYAAWTWDAWGNCHSLIAGYGGDPASDYGSFVKGYLAGLAAGS
ncbi:MAG TPA: cellulase family glycosylhydrolase [Solirubrobacteraceae bacterium]|nr:cellulase family glycosylhydrolase [Solirubrobacteraceae bacterium]